MTDCWPEGELRAYLDRELPGDVLDRIAAHLEQCPECARAAAEMRGRAVWVGERMSALSVTDMTPRRARVQWRWAAAAAALVAGIAIGVVARSHAPQPRVSVVSPAPAPVTEAAAPEAAGPVVAVQRPVPRRRVRRPPPPDNQFLALDDEPFETGVVLRMALGPAEVPADVLVGPDGRAHAIRLVNYK